jgi:hypothetical protein
MDEEEELEEGIIKPDDEMDMPPEGMMGFEDNEDENFDKDH